MTSRTPLDIRISSRAGVTIVTLRGFLDVSTAPLVRNALLKCVADQPVALIADLTRLELRKAYTLSVFTLVARRAAEWSGMPLILVATSGAGSRLDLQAKAIARFLPVYADLDAAVAAARQPPPRRITRIRLAPTPHSAATARRVVAATCQVWDCTELVEDASAVASELVANAVRHAGTDAELRLELRRELLTVALIDDDPSPPQLHPAAELAAGGYGLRIVDSLSRAWGWVPTSSGGKIVWAVLRTSPERRSNGRVTTSR